MDQQRHKFPPLYYLTPSNPHPVLCQLSPSFTDDTLINTNMQFFILRTYIHFNWLLSSHPEGTIGLNACSPATHTRPPFLLTVSPNNFTFPRLCKRVKITSSPFKSLQYSFSCTLETCLYLITPSRNFYLTRE